MQPKELIDTLTTVGRLKDTTRHSYTALGRHESVAEHSWRTALMAYLLKDEFPEADIDKVIKMCILHDIGEAFTGDIPAFNKTSHDDEREEALLYRWVDSLPSTLAEDMRALYSEMAALKTLESKIFKAIDGLEAVLQHNEAPLDTWIPKEYELNQSYAQDKTEFSPYLKKVREILRQDTLKKINQ